MDYRTMPGGAEKVSLLGLGCMRLPTHKDESIDYPAAKQMVDQALAGGINYFDTAYGYHNGKSEEFVGRALADVERSRYYLASKMPVYQLTEAQEVPRIFEEQLRRCRTDYFDYYLLHSLDAGHFQTAEKLGVYGYLRRQQEQGRIRRLGFSFHDTPEVLETICAAHEWDFAQIQLNYLDWEDYRSREQYEILRRHNLPCIIMEPVRGGALADLGPAANAPLQNAAPHRSTASWAIRYAAGLPGVLTVLSGMSTPAQLADNLATCSPLVPLSPPERAALDEALALYRNKKTIPCTACRYCMPCPEGVDIPGIFSLYNTGPHSLNISQFQLDYNELPQEARASRCVECGQCTTVCPQHLPIPKLLSRIEAGKEPMLQD